MYIIPTRALVGAITKIIETLKMMSPFSDFSVVGCCQYFLRKRLSDFESYSQGAARKVQGFGSGDTLAQNLIHMYQACKNYYILSCYSNLNFSRPKVNIAWCFRTLKLSMTPLDRRKVN